MTAPTAKNRRDLAAIDAVLQHEIECATGELVTATVGAVNEGTTFAAESRSIEFNFKDTHRATRISHSLR